MGYFNWRERLSSLLLVLCILSDVSIAEEMIATPASGWIDDAICVSSGEKRAVDLSGLASDSWRMLVLTASQDEQDNLTSPSRVDIRSITNREVVWSGSIADGSVITGPLYPDRVSVESQKGSTVRVCVSSVLLSGTVPNRDSQVGDSFHAADVLSTSIPSVLSNYPSVVLIHFFGIRAGKKGVWPCTGFFVAPTLVMTAWHCVRGSDGSNRGQAYVGYDRPTASLPSSIAVKSVVSELPDLDVAILGVELPPSSPAPKVARLDTNSPVVGSEVLVIHHYRGDHKVYSYDSDSTVRDVRVRGSRQNSLTDFTHGSDTDPISSGSPVVSVETGLVVGLHHYGTIEGGQFEYNRAVMSSVILQAIPDDLRRRIIGNSQ